MSFGILFRFSSFSFLDVDVQALHAIVVVGRVLADPRRIDADKRQRRNVIRVQRILRDSMALAQEWEVAVPCGDHQKEGGVAPIGDEALRHFRCRVDIALAETDEFFVVPPPVPWEYVEGFDMQLAEKAGIELSIYEVNHHTTHGDAPLEPRNKIVASIGGGINVANNMLMMMREHKLRTQCLFSLIQHGYRAHGIGEVRLWGTALNMRAGHERYRPTFLACMLANKVIGGSLVRTIHSEDEPTFDVRGYFTKSDVETVANIPVIWSYGFAQGTRRGLVLVCLDVSKRREVTVRFAGKVVGGQATCWTLAADRITASNEFEVGEPQVNVKQGVVKGFSSGSKMELAPHSMLVLSWQVEDSAF